MENQLDKNVLGQILHSVINEGCDTFFGNQINILIEIILEKDPDLDYTYNGNNISNLLKVMISDLDDSFKLKLVRKFIPKSNINFQNNKGDTIMHLLLRNKNIQNESTREIIFDLILNSDFDINLINNEGFTILFECVNSKNIPDLYRKKYFEMILKDPDLDINHQCTKKQETVLHKLIYSKLIKNENYRKEMIFSVLDHPKLDINKITKNLVSPMLSLLTDYSRHIPGSYKLEIIKKFVKKEADLSLITKSGNNLLPMIYYNKKGPFTFNYKDYFETLDFLLDQDTLNINQIDDTELSILHWCVYTSYGSPLDNTDIRSKTVERLLKNRIDITLKDDDNATPVHYIFQRAVHITNVEILKLLKLLLPEYKKINFNLEYKNDEGKGSTPFDNMIENLTEPDGNLVKDIYNYYWKFVSDENKKIYLKKYPELIKFIDDLPYFYKLKVVKNDGLLLKYVKNPNKIICRLAIKNNQGAIKYVPKKQLPHILTKKHINLDKECLITMEESKKGEAYYICSQNNEHIHLKENFENLYDKLDDFKCVACDKSISINDLFILS